MIPYDEQYSLEFGRLADQAYADAKRPADGGQCVFAMRAAYDYYTGGLSWPVSRDKHVAELRQALGLVPPFPPPPNRDRACSIRRHFQGMTILSEKYGTLPWFDEYLIAFADELNTLLPQFIDARDTHCAVAPHCSYGEPGQPWGTVVPDRDWWSNPADRPKYLAVVDAVIRSGLIPIYLLDGEGSPAWIRTNLPALVDLLRSGGIDRTTYGPFYVVYDGVWPASWSVQDVKDTLPFIRSVIGPLAHLGMMFGCNNGRPYFYVEDEQDYGKPWMQCLDFVMMSTGPDQVECPALVNGMQYLLGPHLRPMGNCIPEWKGPWLMSPGTPRGPYYGGFDEWNEYEWVRDRVTAEKIANDRIRMENVGIVCHG